MSSSPSPSSSAVTIPTPGKPILKRPPPPQQSFFSLRQLTKLLPTQNAPAASDNNDEARTLKRAHFILPEMTTVYPIYAANPPCSPALRDEKRVIEEREAERRKRIVRRNSVSPDTASQEEQWWSLEQVESFYKECCQGREELPDPAVSAAFLHARGTQPRTVDLSGVQLTIGAASVLSDVFTIEWGLRKLVFKECDLDEQILKPILHSLLIPASLTFLSVASNRRLKAAAFRLIGAYVAKATSLQFLDLSQNALDKTAIQYIAAALPPAPNTGLVSLRLDDCSLRPQSLDALAHAVRVSCLKNISLRYNKINASGAVAVALMIKDYPDRYPVTNGTQSGANSPGSAPSSPSLLSPPGTPSMAMSPLSPEPPLAPPRAGPLPPPPRHPAAGPQTTYTPYIPRARRVAAAAAASLTQGSATPNPLSPNGQQVPIITSSAQGGITARHPVPPPPHPSSLHSPQHHDRGPSAALLDKVRALDSLPRLGALRTLDLRGNDIRNGITYIGQVLKRNRTLKLLNLSENKLDVQGLVTIAEALKYNSCLETLDLSKNPCCGPSLEGVQSLRTAFTLNNALKRLFLSSTSLTSAGAIALAEFLPESTSLLHLDLTVNNLDIAGVMALSSGLKANHVMRCLDLNIPPADEEMARMCREILNTCVRNTEEAERASHPSDSDVASIRGQNRGLWVMIEESELAKSFRQDEHKKVEANGPDVLSSLQFREDGADLALPGIQKAADELVRTARTCKTQLEEFLAQVPSSSSSPALSNVSIDPEILSSAKESLKALARLIEESDDPSQLEELLGLNDELTSLLARCSPKRPGVKFGGLAIQLPEGRLASPVNGSAIPVDLQDDDDVPRTPRIDKGKGRAEPEPEKTEPVLTPTIQHEAFYGDYAEPEDPLLSDIEGIVSPTDRSKSWVAEEGEIFRKGAVLLTSEEMEGEYDSEELRKELLEAMVERPPPRALHDGYEDLTEIPSTPVATSPTESQKPPPRPYIRRSRSSSSVNGSTDSLPSSPSIPGTLLEASS